MFGAANRLAIAVSTMAAVVPPCSAACSQHTFDPCPEAQSSYELDVDPKTGRTWLKAVQIPRTDTSTLGRLSAAARNVPIGPLAKAGEGNGWRTEIKRHRKP